MGTETISRCEARELIEEQSNKIFGCTYRKSDGSLRDMLCRKDVARYTSGGQNPNKDNPDKAIVFDMEKMNELVRDFREKHDKEPNTADKFKLGRQAYRTINIDTLQRLKVNGKEYEVK